jgi:hypothetical protein
MDLLKLNEYQERSYAEKPSNEGYVQYGDDNLFPQYLIDLYKSSATHNALCTSIAYMIYGDGVQADTLEARLKIEEWGLQDEVRKACLDLKIQGGFALEVVYSIDRTTVAKVRHCPFENIRSAEVDNDENVNFYYYSKDWSDNQIEPELVRAFDPEDSLEYPVQILYVKPFSPGSYYYPKPDYIGSIDYIELDKEIGKYHINNIKNGLAPSFSIHFKNGVPAQEERHKIRNDIERQLAGATNAGKFIVTYSDSPERKPDFEPFPLSDAHNQYQFLSEEVVAKIMVGHRVTSPMMFGVMAPGKLGGGMELKTAEEIFSEDVITPYQQVVTEALSSVFNAAGTPAIVTLYKPEAEEANVEVSYTGIQISSAVDIISKVGTGELTGPQAVQLLVAMLGFDRTTAEGLFVGAQPTAPSLTEMSRKACCNLSEEITLNIDAAEWLIEQGEEINEDEWVLIDEREYDKDLEQVQDAQWNFAMRVPGGTSDTNTAPDNRSQIDNDVVKIRYIYDGSQNPERDFCQKMMSSQRVYRREDIVGANWPASLGGASARAVNPGFGPNGTDTYDLLLYKGGPNCKHRWIRRTYLKRNNQRVSVNRARQIISQLPEPQRRANQIETQDPRISQIPATMPNNGYLNPR